MTDDVLPDRLRAGDRLKTVTGVIVTVVTTSKKSSDDEPLVRLRHASGTIGHGMWTRDMLQESGAVLINETEKGE